MNKNNKRNRKYYYLKKDGGNMFFRTDLAVERREIFKRANKINSEIDGIKIETKNLNDIKVTNVKIENEKGAEALKRKIGNYITIDLDTINNLSLEKEKEVIQVFSDELKTFR